MVIFSPSDIFLFPHNTFAFPRIAFPSNPLQSVVAHVLYDLAFNEHYYLLWDRKTVRGFCMGHPKGHVLIYFLSVLLLCSLTIVWEGRARESQIIVRGSKMIANKSSLEKKNTLTPRGSIVPGVF